MKSTEIRNGFLNYFQQNGHTIAPSSSLIPENDPTLLFANAGMNQFKNTFLGLEKRDYNRATTSQNCVRAGGKHNDLENVGFTARHHTYFEMLGNFSFGDYFKKDAIHFAWELLTREFQIPKEKLYVTVFEKDDDAAEIWHRQEGVPRDRIFRFGEKDNFWRMGDTGPCGPCSEIFYDHGPLPGMLADPFQGIAAGQDRYVEIWNLVFMQFDEVSPGNLVPLPKPSVDTGSGLERVTAALQGKVNNYDTDLFRYLVDEGAQIAKLDIEQIFSHASTSGTQLAALRVLADHTRASSMLLAAGILPSNEGRGYVLRRIIRRALRFGRKLNPDAQFLTKLAGTFIQNFSAIHPQLTERKKEILAMLTEEESKFLVTLDTGTEILEKEMKSLKGKTLPGELVFKLYDTFGFPVDLTELMAREQGIEIDPADFDRRMKESQAIARQSWKGKSSLTTNDTHQLQLIQKFAQPTQFQGYEHLDVSTKIVGLSNGESEVAELTEGQSGILIAEATPFYAESGGQVGDQGHGKSEAAQFQIEDVQKKKDVFFHFVTVTGGVLKKNDAIDLTVSTPDRRETAAHHSATHLLHAALRQILGTSVKQAGSLVTPHKLRFDFTHPRPVSPEELAHVENLVNEVIARDEDAQIYEMSYPEAIKLGAMALFGEKYGDVVRVLKIGDFSTELCGGTHVSRTSQIRLFKIVSQSSVASGVRRLEAVVSKTAFDYLNRLASDDLSVRENLGVRDLNIPSVPKIEGLKKQIVDLQRELQKTKVTKLDVASLKKNIRDAVLMGVETPLLLETVDASSREELLAVHDQLKGTLTGAVLILVSRQSPHICLVSAPPQGPLKAGELFKFLTQKYGGKGGGRPDLAQGSLDRLPSFSEIAAP